MRQYAINASALTLALLGALGASAAQAQQAQNDPLYRYQWHLMNYGQAVLGDTRPAFGIDLGIDDLHAYNIRGRGVVVSVVDDGLEIAHPDLAANVVPNGSLNLLDGSHDPTPVSPGAGHGTAVGGIIGAVGWNGIGVRGVAPAARLKGFNYLSAQAAGNLERSWWNSPEASDVQVANSSFGFSLPYVARALSENEIAAFERPMSATRGGLGTVYVKAAGNDFNSVPVSGVQTCVNAIFRTGVGCSQAFWDWRNSLFNVMTIASVNAAGRRSSYSTPGSTLWVSGLGGEYGHQRAFSSAVAAVNFDPAIVTTDRSGCVAGYNNDTASARRNALDSSQSAIEASCNYTGRMNGTSAATPSVAGVIALMLQANPKLSYRDVKYILATTARRVDPNQAPVVNAAGTTVAPGWTVNAAGRAFSNWYGFGLVDATLATTTATSFKPLGALLDSGWQHAALAAPVAIGDAAAPARATLRIGNGVRRVEAVQIGVATDYVHGGSNAGAVATPLLITLVSPGGTRAYVLPAGTGFIGRNGPLTISLAAVNGFLDEAGDGDWTLEIADTSLAAGAASKGNLTSFKIRVLGH